MSYPLNTIGSPDGISNGTTTHTYPVLSLPGPALQALLQPLSHASLEELGHQPARVLQLVLTDDGLQHGQVALACLLERRHGQPGKALLVHHTSLGDVVGDDRFDQAGRLLHQARPKLLCINNNVRVFSHQSGWVANGDFVWSDCSIGSFVPDEWDISITRIQVVSSKFCQCAWFVR